MLKGTFCLLSALGTFGCEDASLEHAQRAAGGRAAAETGPRSDASRPLAMTELGPLPFGSGGETGAPRGADASKGGKDAVWRPVSRDSGSPPGDSGDDAAIDASADASEDAVDAPVPCHALTLKLLTAGLKNPVYATAPIGDDRIFVLERVQARIVIVDAQGLRAAAFLDLSTQVSVMGFEAGLLSLVFHPDFAKNGTFYVSYTTGTTLRVSRFRVPAATPDVADVASESVVIEIPQLTHHNTGGMLLFGPDGFLYVSAGDDDYEGVGQDLGVLTSKILRLDVDPAVDGYRIPAKNPFVGVGGALPETWAYGLREPYRFWFDAQSGDLYISDVGENAREEIDVVQAGSIGGENFGWPIMEGSICHTPASGCQKAGLKLPAYEYSHTGGTAVIGGSVYRGTALSECFRGRYFLGAYPSGWLRTLQWKGGVTDVSDEPGVVVPNLVSFGQDGHGEILMLGYDQTLHRIVSGK